MADLPITGIKAELSAEGFRTTFILNERSPLSAGPFSSAIPAGNTVAIQIEDAIGITYNFLDASPNYTSRALPGGTGVMYRSAVDPWVASESRKAALWLACENGLWMTGNIHQASPAWINPISASDFASATGKTLAAVRNVKGTIAGQNRFYIQALATDDTLYVGMTADNGDTWTFTSVGVVPDTTVPLGFEVSKHDPLKVWSAGLGGTLHFSDDGAASFSTPLALHMVERPIMAIEAPYEDNPNDQTIYISVDIRGYIPLIVIRTTQGIFWSRTVGDVSPTWTAANNGLTTAQKTSIRSIALDPKGTGPTGGIITPTLYMTCSEGLFRNRYITSNGTWEQMKTNADAITMINAAGGDCTPVTGTGGWFTTSASPRAVGSLIQVIAGGALNPHAGYDSHKRVFYSTDGLTSVAVGGSLFLHSNHCEASNGNSITTFDGRTAYSFMCAWWPGSDEHAGYSDDGGVTVVDNATLVAYSSHHPYHTRSGYNILYWRFGNSSLQKSTNGGLSYFALSALPAAPVNNGGGAYDNQALMLHPNDINSALVVTNVLRKSVTGGVSWTVAPANIVRVACISPVPGDRDRWLVGRGTIVTDPENFIYYTEDFATSWSNKTGNLGNHLNSGDDVQQIVYSTAFPGFGAGTWEAVLLKSTDNFDTFLGVIPDEGGMAGLESIKTAELDEQVVVVLVREDDTEEHHTVASDDGADTWTEKSDFNSIAPADADGQGCLGLWPYDADSMYALQHRSPGGSPADMIRASVNQGGAWASKVGDWATAIQATWGLTKSYAGTILPIYKP